MNVAISSDNDNRGGVETALQQWRFNACRNCDGAQHLCEDSQLTYWKSLNCGREDQSQTLVKHDAGRTEPSITPRTAAEARTGGIRKRKQKEKDE